MSKQRLTLQEIPTLKRLAKTIKRDLKISHSEALNQIAVQYGYVAWSQLHSEAVDTQRVEQLLREFANGKREQQHLNFLLRLWEHQASFPEVRPFVSNMLSQLSTDEGLTMVALLAEHPDNHSPLDLLSAIDLARAEWDAKLDKVALCESGKHEHEIEGPIDDQESEEELAELMSRLPLSTQNIIWNYKFAEVQDTSANTLSKDIELYKRNRKSVAKALLFVAELYTFKAFSAPQALNEWLKTGYVDGRTSRCPLDALWNNDVLISLGNYAEKAHAIYQRGMIEEWRLDPVKVPSEVRHLLDDMDIALRNFSTIETAVFAEAIPEMARKLDELLKPIE